MSDELTAYRKEIDRIDEELHRLYKERIAISRKIGTYKRKHGQPILDVQREAKMKGQLQERYRDDVDCQAYMYLQAAMMRVSRNVQCADQAKISDFTDELALPVCADYQEDEETAAVIAADQLFGD